MKLLLIFFVSFILFWGCSSEPEKNEIFVQTDSLNVAVFQSFDSENLGGQMQDNLLRTYSIQLKINYFNDILQEKDALESICQAHDVIIGLNNIAYTEISDSLFLSFKPENLLRVGNEYIFDTDFLFLPYGFHYLGLLYHPDLVEQMPETFGHLQDKIWNNKILAPNCETTTSGRALLYLSVALFENNGYRYFWRSINTNFNMIYDDYQEAKDRFLVKEVPFLFHYISSAKQPHDISYFMPLEGYFQVIEAMAISAFSSKKDTAKSLVNLLLSEQFQEMIAHSNSLLPVYQKVLDKEDEILLPNFNVTNRLSNQRIKKEREIWLSQWKRIAKK